MKLKHYIGSYWQIIDDTVGSLHAYLHNNKVDNPKVNHFLRGLLVVLLFIPYNLVYAQRYTGYGRGMDTGDDWDFSPVFKLLFFAAFIGICIIGGPIGLLEEKLNDRKQKKNSLNATTKVVEDKVIQKEEIGVGGTTSHEQTIEQSILMTWSLIDFARAHGIMQVGEFKYKDSEETFKTCIFTNPKDGTRVFVSFSPTLGELTPTEIASMKDDLVVVQNNIHSYSLCKRVR